MNSLTRRIVTLGARQPRLTPARGTVPGPSVHVPHHVQIMPGIGAGLSPLAPLIASDGAAIPATGPGQWDQLIAAGRL